jgi:hypothetical protein
MSDLITIVVSTVVSVLVFTVIVLVLALYWSRIFGRVAPDDHNAYASSSRSEKSWPKSRDSGSMVESTWSTPSPVSSPRHSRTVSDPPMQKALVKS